MKNYVSIIRKQITLQGKNHLTTLARKFCGTEIAYIATDGWIWHQNKDVGDYIILDEKRGGDFVAYLRETGNYID